MFSLKPAQKMFCKVSPSSQSYQKDRTKFAVNCMSTLRNLVCHYTVNFNVGHFPFCIVTCMGPDFVRMNVDYKPRNTDIFKISNGSY